MANFPSAGSIGNGGGGSTPVAQPSFGQTESVTANKTLTAADSGKAINNEGAAGAIVITLPTPSVGLRYSITVSDAQQITVQSAGGAAIYMGQRKTVVNGNARSAVIGSRIVIEATSATEWIAESSGQWALEVATATYETIQAQHSSQGYFDVGPIEDGAFVRKDPTSGKFISSGLTETGTGTSKQISADADFVAKKIKAKQQSMIIGENMSIGNSGDDLTIRLIAQDDSSTTANARYNLVAGATSESLLEFRRLWNVDNRVIQSDFSENSSDNIGYGVNTVAGEMRTVITTGYAAFRALVQTFYFRGNADTAGARFVVHKGSTISSPLVYKQFDDFDFNAGIGTRIRSYGQTLTGTVGITNASATLTGVGTSFTTQFIVDDMIDIAGTEYVVSSVESDTSLTLKAEQGYPLPTVTLSAQVLKRGSTLARMHGGFYFEPNTSYFIRVHSVNGGVDLKGKKDAIGQTGQFVEYFYRVWQDIEIGEVFNNNRGKLEFSPQIYSGNGSIAINATTVTGTDTSFTTDFQVGDLFDLNGQIFTIASIASDTSLAVNEQSLRNVTNIGIYRYGDFMAFTDAADRQLLTIDQQRRMTIHNALKVKGNLHVEGTTTTVNSETLNVAANNILLNDGYTPAVAQTGGFTVIYLPTNTTTTASSYTAGVAATSNPKLVTAGSGTFAAGDIVLISGATVNTGIYEVHSHVGTELQLRGVGVNARVEDFTLNQLTTQTAAGVVTKVNVSNVRVGTDGVPEFAKGNTTGFAYKDLMLNAGSALTQGSITFADSSGAITQNNANLFWDNTNNRLGVKTSAPKVDAQVVGGMYVGKRNTTAETDQSRNADVLNVIAATNQTGTGTSVATVMRMQRDGETGTKYNMVADWQMGTRTAGINAASQLKLRLNNGATHAPDTDVAFFNGDGSVGVGRLGVGVEAPATGFVAQVVGKFGVTGNDAKLGASNQVVAPSWGLHLQSDANDAIPVIAQDMYSSSASSTLRLRRSRGTIAAPTAILNGDVLGSTAYQGYNSSAFAEGAKFEGVAIGDYALTNKGAKLEFTTTAFEGVPAKAATIEGNGDLTLEKTLQVKGGVIGTGSTDGADVNRLRITAGNADTFDNSRGASIDLHGNEHFNTGRLDLVAGENADVTVWTGNTERMKVKSDGNVYAAEDIRAKTLTISDSEDDTQFPSIVMTAANAPSPYVVSTSAEGGTNQGWKAMDGNDTTSWAKAGAGNTTEWIKIDLGSQIQADSARVIGNGTFTNWNIEGSNDDSAWTVLFTQAAAIPATSTVVTFTQNIAAYRYYRVIGTSGSFAGMKVWELQGTTSSPKLKRTGDNLELETKGTTQVVISNSTTTIKGQLKVEGGSPAAGKVLTSDADGLAAWETITIPSSGWADGGAVVRLDTVTDDVGIGTATPNAKAKVDVVSTTKGFMLPRWTDAQQATNVAGLVAGDEGLTWFNTTTKQFMGWNGASAVIMG